MQFFPARIVIAVLAFIVGAVLALPMLVSRKMDTGEAVPPAADVVAMASTVLAGEGATAEAAPAATDCIDEVASAGVLNVSSDDGGLVSAIAGYAALPHERIDTGKRLDDALPGGPDGLRRPSDTSSYRVDLARYEPPLPEAPRLFDERRYHLRP